MRDLARKPLEEIREMLGGIKPANLENSALEGWTKIILGNRSIQDNETPPEGGGGRSRTVDPVDPPELTALPYDCRVTYRGSRRFLK